MLPNLKLSNVGPSKEHPSWSTPGSVEANLEPIRQTLASLLGQSTTRRVLELASGFGAHTCSWAVDHPRVSFRPSEVERELCEQVDSLVEAEELDNVAECQLLDIANEQHWDRAKQGGQADVIIAINTLNVTPWSVTETLFANVKKVLVDESHATLVIYAAHKQKNMFRTSRDEAFDQEIRKRDESFGIRDIEAVDKLARTNGLKLDERHALKSGNWMLMFRRAEGEQQATSRGPPPSDWQHTIPSERFPSATGRYHLYAAWFCPFAQRALILRELKGLQDVITVSIVHWWKGEEIDGVFPGWHFDETEPGCTDEPLFGARLLSEIYFRTDPRYKGRYTVPVLFDKQTNTIVSNDSAQIMRTLSTAFEDYCAPERKGWTYSPSALLERIDEESAIMQPKLNAGVYKTGWAKTQKEYEQNVRAVFDTLDRYEAMLEKGPFLFGDVLTELDVRLYTTVIRFDVVYVRHFKCNLRQIRDDGYPRIHLWLRRLYHTVDAFKSTTNFNHIKANYFRSHGDVNPQLFEPIGPLPHINDLESESIKLDSRGCRVQG